MPFFGSGDWIVCMRVTLLTLGLAMTVAVFVEEEESEDIGGEAHAADYQDQLGVGDFLDFDKSLNGLEEDG